MVVVFRNNVKRWINFLKSYIKKENGGLSATGRLSVASYGNVDFANNYLAGTNLLAGVASSFLPFKLAAVSQSENFILL